MQARLASRHAAERRFRLYGLFAIGVAVATLGGLLFSIVGKGYTAFVQTEILLDVYFDAAAVGDLEGLGDDERTAALRRVDYAGLLRDSLRAQFPEVEGRSAVRALTALVSAGARTTLREELVTDPDLLARRVPLWLTADDEVDMLMKGQVARDLPESERRLSDAQLAWVDALAAEGRIRTVFNRTFLTAGDSREPELAGIWGALVGTVLTLAVTLAVSFPMGVLAAVYLEEFAPRNRWTDLIEVNINNLAAVPSIVFGLLGLAVFLNVLNLPRSAPLVGGLTLALMTLPTIIIAARSAILSVPPSIREAARGVGASPLQVVAHHVLPLALPGILTGAIIGMARALGETAPLLMIGMVAFIVDVPASLTDAATALPVQVFLWADSPERGFVEKVSGAILVLLTFLLLMNAGAIVMRQKFEKRW